MSRLLGDNGMRGKVGAELLGNQTIGRSIHIGDEIDHVGFYTDLFGLKPVFLEQLSSLLRNSLRNLLGGCHQVVHIGIVASTIPVCKVREQTGQRKTMRVLAPAKVNLFLRIIGHRSDGYHLLDSLMAPVSLYDEIEIIAERTAGTKPHIRVRCNDPTIPTDQSNLAYRAAVLLCQEAGIGAHIIMTLHKNIPAGAGLGGGSSDAAAVLKALNQAFSLGLNTAHLCRLAAQLGADIPFFIPCQIARVGGIGEVLTLLPPLPQRWLVIVVPGFPISTPWAYQRFDALLPDLPEPKPHAIDRIPPLDTQQWPSATLFVNDLEQAVLPEYPLIADRKKQLTTLGAEVALMSGSGSAVFGIFKTQEAATHATAALAGSENVFVVTLLEDASTPVTVDL